MKNKPVNIEYKIEDAKWKDPEGDVAKKCAENGELWILYVRRQGDESWGWHGPIAKEDAKKRLSDKQYSKWRQGKSNEFVVERTKEDSKNRMIKSNKK